MALSGFVSAREVGAAGERGARLVVVVVVLRRQAPRPPPGPASRPRSGDLELADHAVHEVPVLLVEGGSRL